MCFEGTILKVPEKNLRIVARSGHPEHGSFLPGHPVVNKNWVHYSVYFVSDTWKSNTLFFLFFLNSVFSLCCFPSISICVKKLISVSLRLIDLWLSTLCCEFFLIEVVCFKISGHSQIRTLIFSSV